MLRDTRLSNISRALNARPGRLALMAALAATFLSASVAPAAAATPLTGETLTGAGPTTSGYGNGCPNLPVSGGDTFNLSGTASGPYPGTFTETGSFGFSYQVRFIYRIWFHASFTITSGTTKITGSISGLSGAFSVSTTCSPTGTPLSYHTVFVVPYTAVINGHTYQGTVAKVVGTFATQTGAQTSVSATLTG